MASDPQHANAPAAPGELDRLATALEQLQVADAEIETTTAELVATRDELAAERARYQELFELAPDPYVLTDADGIVGNANRAAGALFGLDRRFLLGKPLQVFIPPDERHRFRARIVQFKRTDVQNFQWRLRIVPRGGATIDVAAAVAPILGHGGALSGFRWSLRDITDRVREEDRLRDVAAELERHVAERTAALEAANREKDVLLRREREAREAAERANRIKDEFLATLSHELRTPLNVVVGQVFRLRRGGLDAAEQQKALETVERNAQEQSRLVDDLLDTARITNGRLQLDFQVAELSPIVRSALEAVEAAAAARGVRLHPRLQYGVFARCDPERIRQVAWNLLVNAVKFTPEGGTISIDVTRERSSASLVVTDTGVGIEPHVISHVFERFWQAEQSPRRTRGGLGLGLAIVKQLVEMHGGEVDVYSAGRGTGATFTVRLPLVRPLNGSPQT